MVEEWKWGKPVWSHDGLICTGETYENYVKTTFAKRRLGPRPQGPVQFSLDGNVRRAIDFRQGEPIVRGRVQGSDPRRSGGQRGRESEGQGLGAPAQDAFRWNRSPEIVVFQISPELEALRGAHRSSPVVRRRGVRTGRLVGGPTTGSALPPNTVVQAPAQSAIPADAAPQVSKPSLNRHRRRTIARALGAWDRSHSRRDLGASRRRPTTVAMTKVSLMQTTSTQAGLPDGRGRRGLGLRRAPPTRSGPTRPQPRMPPPPPSTRSSSPPSAAQKTYQKEFRCRWPPSRATSCAPSR
ncbi:hypothetical protein ACRAWD_07000 [Caulobacter segnis]